MKIVLASYGGRGDIEPSVVVGRELLRRGHDVQIAVPPNLVGFAEAAGLAATAYGLDSRAIAELQRNYWTRLLQTPWRARELDRVGREIGKFVTECWPAEVTSTTLTSMASGADMLVAGLGFEQFAANVAEYQDIPFATLHFYPVRSSGQVLRFLPAALGRRATAAYERLSWSGAVREVEDAQRRALGLSQATTPWPQRIADRGSLEIQAYEEVCFPGLTAEWAKWGDLRPFVGTLALELATDADEEVASWISSGTPPIFFSFGSIPLESAGDTLAMIGAACTQLGERALVAAGGTYFGNVPSFEHVKVVGAVNYASTFPRCRAVVHHGGSGTTAAALRAGVPMLILWTLPDQPLFGAAVKRLKVGTARRFSTTTEKSLVSDLRTVLSPQYLTKARRLVNRVTETAGSVKAAADLLEKFAQPQCVG
jgi:UDP:flavonoid glycosyltransferase YjiC (YdhE family)